MKIAEAGQTTGDEPAIRCRLELADEGESRAHSDGGPDERMPEPDESPADRAPAIRAQRSHRTGMTRFEDGRCRAVTETLTCQGPH